MPSLVEEGERVCLCLSAPVSVWGLGGDGEDRKSPICLERLQNVMNHEA